MASAFERISGALSSLGKRRAPPIDEADNLGRSASKHRRVVFRPWDQSDLHRRLETYKPLTWFAKPDNVSPVVCASRGWFNEARDQLCCEFCGVRLIFPKSLPIEARERAANMFAEQLVTRHEAHCPWRHTRCDDSVLAFNPTNSPNASHTPDAYHARLAKLEHCEQLPDMYPRAIQNLANQAGSSIMNASPEHPHRGTDWGTQSLRKVLALPAPPQKQPQDVIASIPPEIPPAFDTNTPIVIPANLTMSQKARLLALLGWDAEELPPGTISRPPHLSAYRPSNEAYSLAHLLGSAAADSAHRAAAANSGNTAGKDVYLSGPRWSMDNVILNCPSCKSRVGLWNFIPNTQQARLALPAPPSSTQHDAQSTPVKASTDASKDNNGVTGMSTSSGTQEPVATVPLIRTIAGGAYEPGTYTGSSVKPVFGTPSVSRTPVYGLSAIALPDSQQQATDGVAMDTEQQTTVGHKRKASETSEIQPATPPPSTPASTPPGSGFWSKRLRAGSDGGTAARKSTPAPTTPASSHMVCDAFDPLSHHRAWCPWVFTGTCADSSNKAAGSPAKPANVRTKCGWMHLLDSLVDNEPSASIPSTAPTITELSSQDGPNAVAGSPATQGKPSSNEMETDEEQGGDQTAKPKDIVGLKDSILRALRSF